MKTQRPSHPCFSPLHRSISYATQFRQILSVRGEPLVGRTIFAPLIMYFQGHDIPVHRIERVLGPPISKGVRGSTIYFIKKCIPAEGFGDLDLDDFKALFQLYDQGLLMHAFRSHKRFSIPIRRDDIQSITLQKGSEYADPLPLFPMWILLKLGVPLEIARYFSVKGEYSIAGTGLRIHTSTFKIALITNGYTFPGQARFFKKLDLGARLSIEEQPAN